MFDVFKNIGVDKHTFTNMDHDPLKRDAGPIWYPLSSGGAGGSDNVMLEYLQIPEMFNIINIHAKAMASGIMTQVNNTTGDDMKNTDPLVKVLRNPNWFQAYTEFWRQTATYRGIYAEEFLYFLTPLGRPNTYKGLFTLDPARIEIEFNGDDRFFLEENDDKVQYFYIGVNGSRTPLLKENLIHLNDSRVGANIEGGVAGSSGFLRSRSKIKALKKPLDNIRRAYRKRGVILNTSVAIFSQKAHDSIGQATPMDEEERKIAEGRLYMQGPDPIITGLNLDYAKIDLKPADMGLYEEVREDTMRVCDAYGVPYEVLSNNKSAGLANGGSALKEAKKQMYEESIIPDVNEKDQAINSRYTEGKAWTVKTKFDHLPLFAEDKKQKAVSYKMTVDALSIAFRDGAITIEEYRERLKNI